MKPCGVLKPEHRTRTPHRQPARLRLDGYAHDTTSPGDTFFPTWVAAEQLVTATAAQLLTYVNIEVWDEDLSIHDLVGSCLLRVSAEQFDGGLQQFECWGSAGERLFALTYELGREPGTE